MTTPNMSPDCCWMGIGMMVGWWIVGSGLLWLTWNHVVGALTKAKQAKYWQALLLVATICVLCCLPKYYMKKHGDGCCHKGGCPLSKPEAR